MWWDARSSRWLYRSCTARLSHWWDQCRAKLHESDRWLSAKGESRFYVWTHRHTQTKEREQTVHMSCAADAFQHLLMSPSGGDIQAGCLLTYAWILEVMVVCSPLGIIVKWASLVIAAIRCVLPLTFLVGVSFMRCKVGAHAVIHVNSSIQGCISFKNPAPRS